MPAASAAAAIRRSGCLTERWCAPPLRAELLVDPQRALPLLLSDRAVGKRGELLAELGEFARVAGAVEQLEADHVARRQLVRRRARCRTRGAAPGRPPARPDPRARVGELRQAEPARRAAHRLQGLGRQILEVSLCKSRAASAGDHVAQCLMDGVGRPLCAERVRGLLHEVHVEVDVRALDHASSVHLRHALAYTSVLMRPCCASHAGRRAASCGSDAAAARRRRDAGAARGRGRRAGCARRCWAPWSR